MRLLGRVGAGAVALIIGLFGGIGSVNGQSGIYPPDYQWASVNYRPNPGAMSVPRGGTEASVVVCVEPSLEAGLAFADRIVTDASRRVHDDTIHAGAIELARQTQMTLMSLRDRLARLCERVTGGTDASGRMMAERSWPLVQ